jgi:two-component system phosphate regulon sensor histidine kinase PhoR
MSKKTIRWLVLVSALSIIGVVVTQIYWVKKTLDIREKQFNLRAHTALLDIAEQLAALNNVSPGKNPVEQLSPNYFLVNTNSITQSALLEYVIKENLTKYNLITDFEIGIYDCNTDKLHNGMALSTRNSKKASTTTIEWPKTDKFSYYFAIRFPAQIETLTTEFQGWIGSTLLILIALGFFAYALFVILHQKQLSDIQRDFINNMTHELQTPISTIRIAADVLNNPAITQQPERHKRYVSMVEEEILRLQRQVEMVLNMAKAEENKLTLDIEWLDAHAIIKGLLSKYEGKTKVYLEAQNSHIQADHIHFRNLINNLIDNGLKYSTDASPVILKTYNEKGHLILSVKDQGIGIAREHQKKIFEKFYRVPSGNIHNVKGFGIGLSYVQQIVRTHHWKLEVISALGSGSEFKVIIPIPTPND